MMLCGWVVQLKLIAIKLRHYLRTINVHHAGDCRHAHNIQINKVIGENEKCVFYFMEKNHRNIFGQPNKTFMEIQVREHSI